MSSSDQGTALADTCVGLVAAGGKSMRLRPLTTVTNKHLLPIYDRPMILYPVEAMARAGVRDVVLITNPEHVGQFVNLLRTGADWGLRITYEVQENPIGGIAETIQLAEPFARGRRLLMLLGDGIFTFDLSPAVRRFLARDSGAVIFSSVVRNPGEFGVLELDGDRVVSIEEKPIDPKSHLIQTGIYMYDERVFDFARALIPSARGQLEITSLNNAYLEEGTLRCEPCPDWWIDAGTSYDDLLAANLAVAHRHGSRVATDGGVLPASGS